MDFIKNLELSYNNNVIDNPLTKEDFEVNNFHNWEARNDIEKYLEKAGFDTSIYSTHKLRHTAATLMYRYGNVDIRALKDILGHTSISTTQIYTHLEDEDLKKAIDKNPLSNMEI